MLLHLHHDHDPGPHAADPAERDRRAFAMRLSLGVAVLMLIGKLAAYFLTGSTAILSDALESVIHLFATAVAGVSLWYAAQPPDPAHPYGHGKAAYFSSGLEGGLILLAALGILWEAGTALIEGPELQRLGTGLLITAALAAVNAALGGYLIRVGKRQNALVLVANGQHVLTDMWTSLGVLVGIGLVWLTGLEWLDPVLAILVGLNITWTAWRLIKRSFDGLMERADPEDTHRMAGVLERAEAEGRIAGAHHLRHRRVNDQVWIEAHLLFPAGLSLDEAHARASGVEADLRALFPSDAVLVTTHLEPDHHRHDDPAAHDVIRDALAPDEPVAE